MSGEGGRLPAPALPLVSVGLCEAAVGDGAGTLVTFGLGSCIGLAVWSPLQRLGALCHIMLPDSQGAPPDPATPAKYADRAVAWAVQALRARGCTVPELRAKLAGGAKVLSIPVATEIGKRNAEATLALLQAQGIRVMGYSVGGTVGRTVYFSPATGDMEVRPVGGEVIRL